MSHEELAGRLGKGVSTVRAWESGVDPRSLDDAVELCRALGIRVEWYLTGKGPAWLDSASFEISDEEIDLLRKWRNAPEGIQKGVAMILESTGLP